ncbi:acyltransferase [Roseomonas sp. CAU 1739]|uniref:acyltransferase family protein n=1 Tax=Roseomonas sp. CAU 1739 TaxID=3140364 RepID=UPI00325B194A
MQRHTSTYLDLMRFSAAMVVFIGHTAGQRLAGGLGWQLAPFMDEAVTVFFVMSGYVIGYVMQNREATPGAYAVARAARIYSVALPAVIITMILDGLGRSLRPDLYSEIWGYRSDMLDVQFAAAVVFANQLWFWRLPVGSDLPYWSLCFEVWYYVIFGVFVFAPNRWRWPAAGLLLLFVGPRIAALFPVWLLGVLAYRVSASAKVGKRLGAWMFFGSIALVLAHQLWIADHGALPALAPGFLEMPNISNDYVVGILIAFHLVGFNAMGGMFSKPLQALERPIRWCAGATFTIYLFHLPLTQFLSTVVPWPPTSWATRLVMFGGTLVLMFVIAELTERRKEIWRRGFVRLLRVPAPPVATAR